MSNTSRNDLEINDMNTTKQDQKRQSGNLSRLLRIGIFVLNLCFQHANVIAGGKVKSTNLDRNKQKATYSIKLYTTGIPPVPTESRILADSPRRILTTPVKLQHPLKTTKNTTKMNTSIHFVVVVAQGQRANRHDLRNSTKGKVLLILQARHVPFQIVKQKQNTHSKNNALETVRKMMQGVGDEIVQALNGVFRILRVLKFIQLGSIFAPRRLFEFFHSQTKHPFFLLLTLGQKMRFTLMSSR